MEITRDTVTAWLADTRRSRNWLAEQCGVTDQAVSNWLRENNPRAISAAASIKIAELMQADAPATAADENVIRVTFTDEEFATIEDAARIVSTPIKDFITRAAMHSAKEEIAKRGEPARYQSHEEWAKDQPHLKVADDEKEYGSKSSRSGQQ